MGAFFAHEFERLKRLVTRFCDNAHVVAKVVAILDDIAPKAQPP
jgi:hypothetical protein